MLEILQPPINWAQSFNLQTAKLRSFRVLIQAFTNVVKGFTWTCINIIIILVKAYNNSNFVIMVKDFFHQADDNGDGMLTKQELFDMKGNNKIKEGKSIWKSGVLESSSPPFERVFWNNKWGGFETIISHTKNTSKKSAHAAGFIKVKIFLHFLKNW